MDSKARGLLGAFLQLLLAGLCTPLALLALNLAGHSRLQWRKLLCGLLLAILFADTALQAYSAFPEQEPDGAQTFRFLHPGLPAGIVLLPQNYL